MNEKETCEIKITVKDAENNRKYLEEIQVMIQELIDFWHKTPPEDQMDWAKYYVDAYECVKFNIEGIIKYNSSNTNVINDKEGDI